MTYHFNLSVLLFCPSDKAVRILGLFSIHCDFIQELGQSQVILDQLTALPPYESNLENVILSK